MESGQKRGVKATAKPRMKRVRKKPLPADNGVSNPIDSAPKKKKRAYQPRAASRPAEPPQIPKAFHDRSRESKSMPSWEPPTKMAVNINPEVLGFGCKCYLVPVTESPWVRIADMGNGIIYKMPRPWAGSYFRGCDSGSRGIAHIYDPSTTNKYDFPIVEFDRNGQGSYVIWTYCPSHRVFEYKTLSSRLPFSPIEVRRCDG